MLAIIKPWVIWETVPWQSRQRWGGHHRQLLLQMMYLLELYLVAVATTWCPGRWCWWALSTLLVLRLDPIASQEENLLWEPYPSNVAECYQLVVTSACGLQPTDPFQVPGTLSPPRGTLQSQLQPLKQTLVQTLVEGNRAQAARWKQDLFLNRVYALKYPCEAIIGNILCFGGGSRRVYVWQSLLLRLDMQLTSHPW